MSPGRCGGQAASLPPVTTDAHTIAARTRLGEPLAVAELLGRPGVMRIGHFRLLSGLHTDTFVAFSGIAADSAALDHVADWMLGTVAAWEPTDVLAPTTAGVGLASTLARRLSARLNLADLSSAGRPQHIIGTSLTPGARVLLVNDIVTTGAGLRALAELVSTADASVTGAAWFVSRAQVNVTAALDAPTVHIADVDAPAWGAEGCHLCAERKPLEDALDLN